MDRANKMTCPNCGAALKSERGVRVGRKIKCPKCAFVCTVRPEDAEAATRVDPARLGIVLGGALLYLLGGAGLAVYCFSNNAPRHATANVQSSASSQVGSGPQAGSEDDGDAPPVPPPAPALGPASVSTAEQRAIDNAIARGVWFLKDHDLPSGTWGNILPADGRSPVSVGFASLPGLTLLECGVPASDLAVQKAAEYVRREVVQLGNTYDTYQRALAILFLDRLAGSAKLVNLQDDELIQYLALCIIAGQHPTDGAWHYSCPALDRALVPQLLKMLEDKLVSLDQWRQTALKGGTFDVQGWDNSNTQFAILALWAAQRHGVSIGRSIALAEKHFRNTQLPNMPDPAGNNLSLDGSWYYDAGQNSSRWPSMTCAGLLALAEAHGLTTDANQQQQRPPLNDTAIQRGLEMLGREIDRPGEQRPPDYYFLWSLERVGVLYDLPKIGLKDWYTWGYKVLLPRQWADGSWQGGSYYGSNPVLDTCFVLLFLKQANLTRDLTTKLQLLQKR